MTGDLYTVGIDFGTESGRTVLVRVADGTEVATSVHRYPNGVIDSLLPESRRPLPPDWALQDPNDYIEVLRLTVPAVLVQSGVSPEQVIGVGLDFTSCTMLPTAADGKPLCRLRQYRGNPHAWPKLWKHHASSGQARRMHEIARERGEAWLDSYGGQVSTEWFFSKALQILEEDPAVYQAAERLIEAGDWLVWQLTGQERRSACAAGYKAFYQDGKFPDREFFASLHPAFADVVDEKMSAELQPLGACAGLLCEKAAEWTGLRPGTPVAVANIDAHVTVPATGYTEPATLVLIMGTSTCHILVSEEKRPVEGMCGVVQGGVIPGFYGYESGQSAVGDIFGWYVENGLPWSYFERARSAGKDIHDYLAELAGEQAPGEHGVLALDWLNGNRSVLVDAELSGLLMGLTLSTTPVDIYRALMEATAFGTRMIIEAFERSGQSIERVVAAGGLPGRNRTLMQIYADVTGREIETIRSAQGAALGSAMHAAVAAGAYPDISTAARAMGGVSATRFTPNLDASRVYGEIYRDYNELHELFGRSGPDEPAGVMKRLRERRRQVKRPV